MSRQPVNRLVASAAFALAFAAPALAAEPASPPAPLTFANGSVATAEERCGAGDLCATLKLPNGDTISVYNGGAIRCKPYTLKVVRMHNDTKLFDYDAQTDTAHGFFTAGNCSDTFANTYLTIGNAGARLGIFQNTDGSLLARWEGARGFVAPGAAADEKPRIEGDIKYLKGRPYSCRTKGAFGAPGWFYWETGYCKAARDAWNIAHPSPPPSPSSAP